MQNYPALYVKINSKKYYETGEVEVKGQPKTIQEITKFVGTAPKGGFSITREPTLCYYLRNLRGKMGVVLAHLVEDRDSNNRIPYDSGKMSKKIGISQHSYIDTIKYFEEKNMVIRSYNTMMIPPAFIHEGDRQREAMLTNMYDKFTEED